MMLQRWRWSREVRCGLGLRIDVSEGFCGFGVEEGK
jgi:hypothetical protein